MVADNEHKILDVMGDEISREMYINRVAYSNGMKESVEQLIGFVQDGDKFINFMNENKDNLYIFGAGMLGQDLVASWNWKYHFKAFIDNNKEVHGKMVSGIPVISLNELMDEKESVAIIIMSKFHWQQIVEQLKTTGFDESKIFNFSEIYRQLNKKQYFDLEYMKISNHERFVDCGVLDGETSLNLLELCGGKADKIWMFEPDKNNIQKVRGNFCKIEVEYEIIRGGVWSSNTTLHFNSLGNGCASIDADGKDVIEVFKLDDLLADESPSFIKMDIEGAELEALLGSEQIIKKYYPKLAISVYHKPEDIFRIPELILNYYNNYKFYLRHYSYTNSETILYAI